MALEEQQPKPTHETSQSILKRDIESYKAHISEQRAELARMRAELKDARAHADLFRAQLKANPSDEVAKARYDNAIAQFAELHEDLFQNPEYAALMRDLQEVETELMEANKMYRERLN